MNEHRRTTLRTGAQFAAAGLLPPERIAEIDRVAARYAVAVTSHLAERIDAGDPADPIGRQFVPDLQELTATPVERDDPIGDSVHAPVRGIVHRYPDRVLLTPLLHCPVYCRFCFRREQVGGENGALSAEELAGALTYIEAHPAIWEVIVTGGDPLMLPPAQIKHILDRLDAIPHVNVIRFHSRVPVADPGRISPAMVASLTAQKAVWVAVHCNHPREFSRAMIDACRRLSLAGIPLVGQTVLLKGVNDDPGVIELLMRLMVAHRIKPYYLHHLDLAPGTGHFRTTIETGQQIARHLRGRASGLCQPTYVLDIPGGYGKVPLGPSYWDGETAEDWQGTRHPYPPASP